MSPRPPGFVRPTLDPEVIMMICTAGHVDHGKTRLVKLLTGCSTDRLKEEQERGLTIELGFAPCLLKGELAVGIVDVPGHEKFVRNMVAGVSGIDMAVLVIAADDGVMPQTIEHLQIMELVGVRHGMVALTKIDLVDEERVLEVTLEVEQFLRGSFMEGARICPVSAETFDGYFEFYEVLVEQIQGLSRRRSEGIFRMPILNAFAREGFGTVVTGVPVDGTVEIGGKLELVPGGASGKVRGLQRFLRDAAEGGFGQCLALNVSDLGKTAPVRGQVLCRPGYLRAWPSFHLRLEVVGDLEEPLRNAQPIVFHTGTSERAGKLFLLESKTIGAGESGLATVLLNEPVAAALHDRFILRRPSPANTVAGGRIIGLSASDQKPRKKRILESLQLFRELLGAIDETHAEWPERQIEHYLRAERPLGVPLAEVGRGVLLTEATVQEVRAKLLAAERILEPSPGFVIHRESYGARLEEIAARVREAASDSQNLSLTVADLRAGSDWPAPLWARIQADLEAMDLITRRGDKLVLETAVSGLDEKEQELLTRILALYNESGFASPRPDEIPEKVGAPARQVQRLLDLLYARGLLHRLGKNVVLSVDWIRKAQTRVVEVIGERGLLDSGDFKRDIGSTRKYALAILDYLDAKHVTVRRGNMRSLSSNYEKNML